MPADIAIVILAAGGSSRLDKPKQTLPYKNTTLIAHAVSTATASQCKRVIVITGTAHTAVVETLNNTHAEIVENKQWHSGMASSVKAGITTVQNSPEIEGVLIMLCDQPLITTQHLNKLIAEFDTRQGKLIATKYADATGVPAVFRRSLFEDLLKLSGDQGARQLIAKQKDLITVPFEGAALDIDTEDDYQRLLNITSS